MKRYFNSIKIFNQSDKNEIYIFKKIFCIDYICLIKYYTFIYFYLQNV